MFIAKHCNICLKPKKVLFNVIDSDVDNINYLTKLQFIVPEVQWNYNHLICFICVEQLNATYSFKGLCIKSFSLAVKQVGNDLNDKLVSDKLNIIEDGHSLGFLEKSDVGSLPDGEGSIGQKFNPSTSHSQISQPLQNPDQSELYSEKDDNFEENLPSGFEDDASDSDFPPSPPSKKVEASDEKKIPCNDCGKLFKTVSTLKSHALSRHTDRSEWINDCYACDKVFARKSTLVQHIKNKHLEEGEFECMNCLQNFRLKHLLVFHIKDYHMKVEEVKGKQKRSFDCNVCTRVFTIRNALFEHAKKEHGLDKKDVRPYKCDLCDKRFKVSTYLLSHKLYHEGKRTNMCNICGKGFITLKDLKIHETYHSNNFTYCCPECGQTFKNHKLLYAHKISKHVAPEDWKFCCSICQKRFPRVSGYKMHMRRHMGDKRFLCHLCDKKFVSKFQLLRHVESHSNVKRFHCHVCSREYREKRILNIHLFDVHGIGEGSGEKKLCHICSMSFSCNYKLRRHILKHSKPYGCMVCEKRYPDNYHLKQHLQKKHKIEEVSELERIDEVEVKVEGLKEDMHSEEKTLSIL